MAPDQPLRGFVVLVVEDHVEILKAQANLLSEALGCDVLSASSGVDALRIIDSVRTSTSSSLMWQCQAWMVLC